MKHISLLSYLVVISVLFVSGCSGDISSRGNYKKAVSKSFIVTNRAQVTWHLWHQKDIALRKNHSKGYVLSIIDPKTHRIMHEHGQIKNGRYMGAADGAEIRILRMFKATDGKTGTRAEAQITMPNGVTYPCELIWYDFTPKFLKHIKAG